MAKLAAVSQTASVLFPEEVGTWLARRRVMLRACESVQRSRSRAGALEACLLACGFVITTVIEEGILNRQA